MHEMKTCWSWEPSEVISAMEMRALEAAAINGGNVNGGALMEQAGQGVVAAIGQMWPEMDATIARVVVLCGPGNNGGDGYVVARLLAELGHSVDVFALGNPEQLPADARAAFDNWSKLGSVRPIVGAVPVLEQADLVVDGLFGIGLTRGVSDDLGGVFDAISARAHKVAVDVPSGRDTDTGAVLGAHGFPADMAVTFHAPKPVHDRLRSEGTRVCIVDIGL